MYLFLVRSKGRKLVMGGAGDGRAFADEKSNENSAIIPKAPFVKDIGPPNATNTSHKTHTTTTTTTTTSSSSSNNAKNVKMSIIAAYLTPLKNIEQFAAGSTTEKKNSKLQKVKKAPKVWIEVDK